MNSIFCGFENKKKCLLNEHHIDRLDSWNCVVVRLEL